MKPEKEKNPQQVEPEAGEIIGEKSFKNKLFNITYEPTNKKDIYKTGEQYKRKIRGKVEEHIEKNIQFYVVYKVNLTKQNNEGEEETQEAYFHSANRRVLHMEEFDEVHDEAKNKIKHDFEAYMGEQSG